MEPVFLSMDEVLKIHQQQIERYGGSMGVRDAFGLESAVATPEATFGGEFRHASIQTMAAAYLFQSLPEPPVHRRQQTSGCKRSDHISANEQLGADLR
jgi:death on curing protein